MAGQGSSPMQEDPKGGPPPKTPNPAAAAPATGPAASSAGPSEGAGPSSLPAPPPVPSAAEEVAMLDRLLTRLALTEEGKLERVLEKLLPLALSKLGSPHDASRKKVMEMLSHINKRVKAAPSLRLPFPSLLALYRSPEAQAAPLVFNFAMVYADMAFHRCTPDEKLQAVPLLLEGISTRPPQHQAMLLRCAIEGIEPYGTDKGVPHQEAPSLPSKYSSLLSSPADLKTWLAFCQTLLLFSPGLTLSALLPQPPSQEPAAAAAAAAAAVTGARAGAGLRHAGGVPGDAAAAGPASFPGLSVSQVKALLGGTTAPTSSMLGPRLAAKKLAVLNLNLALGVRDQEMYHLFVVAANDSAEAVSRRADELLKRRAGAVDLEDPALVARLLSLFQGTVAAPGAAVGEDFVAPASSPLKLKLLSAFLKSTTAANSFPHTLRIIFDSVYGESATMRTKQLGMEFAVWVFKHAKDEQIKPMAPLILRALTGLLDQGENTEQPDPPLQQLLGFTYQAVGQLAVRAPQLLRKDTDMARRLFTALGATSSNSTRVVIQDAVILLGSAYRDSPPGVKVELEELLLSCMGSPSEAVRFCAVQWATRFFPPTHPTGCYICLLAANDAKPEVREAGERHIRIKDAKAGGGSSVGSSAPSQSSLIFATPSSSPSPSSSSSATPGTTGSVSGSGGGGGKSGSGEEGQALPGFRDLLGVLTKQKPGLLAPVPPEGGTRLALPAGSFLASVRVLMRCWRRQRSLYSDTHSDSHSDAVTEAGGSTGERSKKRSKGEGGETEGGEGAAARGGGPSAGSGHTPVALELLVERMAGGGDGPAAGGAMQVDGESDGAGREGDGAPGGGEREADEALLCLILRHAMAREGTWALHAEAAAALLELAAASISVAQSLSLCIPWLRSFLSHTNSGVREPIAKLMGIVAIVSLLAPSPPPPPTTPLPKTPPPASSSSSAPPKTPPAAAVAVGKLVRELLATAASGGAPATASLGAPTAAGSAPPPPMGESATPSAAAAGSGAVGGEGEAGASSPAEKGKGRGVAQLPVKVEAAQGSLLAVGYIMALARAIPQGCLARGGNKVQEELPLSLQEEAATLLASRLADSTPLILGTAAQALGLLALPSPLPLPLGTPTPSPSPSSDPMATEGTPAAATGAQKEMPANSTVTSTVTVNGGSDGAGGGAPEGRLGVVAALRGLLGHREERVVQRCALALGQLAFADDSGVADAAVDALFGLSKSKNEATLFTCGEALAYAWGALDSPPFSVLGLLGGCHVSLADLFSADASAGASSAAATSATAGATPGGGRAARAQGIARKLLEGFLGSGVKEERSFGAVALLCLLTFCGRSPELQRILPNIQEGFSALLGDPVELTQEVAAQGLSRVYRLGDAGAKQQLVEALVGSLTGTAKKGTAKLLGDTELVTDESVAGAARGGSAGAGTSTGGRGDTAGRRRQEVPASTGGTGTGLATYKELCTLATDMGQPDLIYRFMELANYHASMNSKRGAAFGVASILADEAGEALAPHMPVLLPKLLRMLYDPSKPLADAAAAIWRVLLRDPKGEVDRQWGPVLEELLQGATGRMWRSREASCLALCDLLPSRKYPEVKPYLDRAWVCAFRAADDIKESVRAAGEKLCRTLASLSVRLCDPLLTPPADARAACGLVLPLLLSKGIPSSVSTVQHLSLTTVTKIAKNAGSAIKPYLPELVTAMLEGLSSLEEQTFNYVEMHAERAGISTEKLESARVAMSRDSPMWQTLDHCITQVDDEAMAALLPNLKSLTRSGVGLNTRVGVAKFISALCSRNVGFPGSGPKASALKPPLKPAAVSTQALPKLAGEPKAAGTAAGAAAAAAVPTPAPAPAPKPMSQSHATSLLRLLTAALYSEKAGAARRAWAAACADVARSQRGPGGDAAVERLAQEACGKYAQDEAAGAAGRDTRLAAALLLRELARGSSDALQPVHATVLPVLFLGREDEDGAVKALLEEAWDDAAGSTVAALSLSNAEVTAFLVAGVATSSSWTRKLQAARALANMAQSLKDEMPAESAQRVVGTLCQQLPGRLWEGKEGLLASLALVCQGCAPVLLKLAPSAAATAPSGASGAPAAASCAAEVAAAVVGACERKKMVFRAAAYAALEKILEAFRPQRQQLLGIVAPALFVATPDTESEKAPAAATPPAAEGAPAAPPLEARLQCLAALLSATPSPGSGPGGTSGAPAASASGGGGASSAMEVDQGAGSGALPAGVVVEYEERVRGLLVESLADTQGWTVRLKALNACKPYLQTQSASWASAASTSTPGASPTPEAFAEALAGALAALAPSISSCLHDLKHSPVRLASAECLVAAARLLGQLDAANLGRTSEVVAGVRAQVKEALQGTLETDVNAGVKSAANDALSCLG